MFTAHGRLGSNIILPFRKGHASSTVSSARLSHRQTVRWRCVLAGKWSCPAVPYRCKPEPFQAKRINQRSTTWGPGLRDAAQSREPSPVQGTNHAMAITGKSAKVLASLESIVRSVFEGIPRSIARESSFSVSLPIILASKISILAERDRLTSQLFLPPLPSIPHPLPPPPNLTLPPLPLPPLPPPPPLLATPFPPLNFCLIGSSFLFSTPNPFLSCL